MTLVMSGVREIIDAESAGQTLCSVFAATARTARDDVALGWRSGPDAAWETMTWGTYRESVAAATLGFLSLALDRGGFGVILARNRPEHVIADLGLVHAGLTPVSAYTTLAPTQIAFIAEHCDAQIAIVEDVGFLARLLEVRVDLPNLRHIVLMDGAHEGCIAWKELLDVGRRAFDARPQSFDDSWQQVQPDDLATLIYTSGTTGPPKAVMVTHHNIAWTVASTRQVVMMPSGAKLVSYLPMAHVAERFSSHWQTLFHGSATYMCPELTQLGAALTSVRPTFFFGPPRVWEKLYAGINAGLAAEPDAQRREVVTQAIDTGREWMEVLEQGARVSDELAARHVASAAVLTAIRAKIGLDHCLIGMSGAAPIAPETIAFFRALGLPLTEIWGMSELTGPGTFFMPEGFHVGTVGVSLPGVEMRTAEDGELEVRGGLVTPGYYSDPEKTAETITPDGWLRTGDVATIDAAGYVKIVDRKKELIITSGGKNISPVLLESLLKQHPLIGQACAIGDRRAYITALVVIDPETAPAWAAAHGIQGSVAELASHPAVVGEVRNAVTATNAQVSRAESIRRFAVLPVEWTVDSGELTPTLKMKRQAVHSRYADEIEALYAGTTGYQPGDADAG
jgi:long-chain acyl-CoA synthetase